MPSKMHTERQSSGTYQAHKDVLILSKTYEDGLVRHNPVAVEISIIRSSHDWTSLKVDLLFTWPSEDNASNILSDHTIALQSQRHHDLSLKRLHWQQVQQLQNNLFTN